MGNSIKLFLDFRKHKQTIIYTYCPIGHKMYIGYTLIHSLAVVVWVIGSDLLGAVELLGKDQPH